MSDRTSFIISLLLHVGIFLYLIVSPRARYITPQKYIPLSIVPDTVTVPTPPPETPKPEPTKKKLSKDTIRELQEKLRKRKTPTRKPTRRPKPTKRPTRKPTPTRTPPPTPPGTLIPLTELDKITQPAVTPIVDAATDTVPLYIEDNTGYDFSAYGQVLINQLWRNWRPPTISPPEQMDYATIVTFTVHKDGTVTDLGIRESSGWILMDQTVKEAVQRANPVERLPVTFTSGSIKVRVRFVLPYK